MGLFPYVFFTTPPQYHTIIAAIKTLCFESQRTKFISMVISHSIKTKDMYLYHYTYYFIHCLIKGLVVPDTVTWQIANGSAMFL